MELRNCWFDAPQLRRSVEKPPAPLLREVINVGSVHRRTTAWIDSLGELNPYAAVLAETALVLAADIDDPPETQSGTASRAPFVNSLRATIEKLREVAGADKGDDEGGWGGLTVLPGGA